MNKDEKHGNEETKSQNALSGRKAQTIRRVNYSTKDKILVIVFVLILYSLLGLGLYYDYISK